MVLAGHLVQLDHWKDSTSRKQENSFHSVNRIWSTAPEALEITAVRADLWIMPLSKKRNIILLRCRS